MQSLALPNLERLLQRMTPTRTLGSDEFSLSAPHECALASELGWPTVDGALPLAAADARRAGIGDAGHAWARLTPVHLHLGTEQVSMTNPADLQLGVADSRELLVRFGQRLRTWPALNHHRPFNDVIEHRTVAEQVELLEDHRNCCRTSGGPPATSPRPTQHSPPSPHVRRLACPKR